MPSRKPNQEGAERIRAKFQAAELKILGSDKQRYFRLPYDAALEAIDADLSKTAYRLWIYLSANYPFSDREVDLPSQTELGIRLQVTRQAINIAAAELQAAGLWDFWPERWKGRNLRGYSPGAESGVKENRQVSKKSDTLSKKDDTRCQEKSTPCQKNLTPCQKKLTPDASELLPCKADKAPHTIQTYSDFIQTLSEEERENFLEFGKKKVAAMPKPPELPLKWIEAHWEELRSQWQQTSEGRVAANSQVDWTQHPNWLEWLDFMRTQGVSTFVALGEWLERKTRREIADWAEERNLVWGAES